MFAITGRSPSWDSIPPRAAPTISSSECHSLRTRMEPDSRRVISSRSPISRFSRRASSAMVSARSRRVCSGSDVVLEQARRGSGDGGERSPKIVGHGAQERTPRALGLDLGARRSAASASIERSSASADWLARASRMLSCVPVAEPRRVRRLDGEHAQRPRRSVEGEMESPGRRPGCGWTARPTSRSRTSIARPPAHARRRRRGFRRRPRPRAGLRRRG